MKKKILTALPFILIAATVGAAFPQTRCVWIEKIEGDKGTQRIGLSARVVKLFATPGANFDLNGMRLTFDTLLIVAKNGSTITLKDSTGNGETVIRGGKFNERMDQETPRHNHLIVEESDSGEPPRISKLRVESVEAVGVLLAMMGSKNCDHDIDRIESALYRGGVLYVRGYKKNSRLWMYVN